MKYMLIMNSPRDGYRQYVNWPKKVLEANIAFMQSFATKLRNAGELVDTVGLSSPEQALRVRAGKDGKPITDGVFPETKEFLAGYWLVDVPTQERALEIAAEASTAPGVAVVDGAGQPVIHFWIEVRQVMGSHRDV